VTSYNDSLIPDFVDLAHIEKGERVLNIGPGSSTHELLKNSVTSGKAGGLFVNRSKRL